MIRHLAGLVVRPFLNRPIFVIGAGRSGTSALIKALGEHPLIFPSSGEAVLVYQLGGVVAYLELSQSSSYQYREANMRAGKDEVYSTFRRFCFESIAGRSFGAKLVLKTALTDIKNARPLAALVKRHWCTKTFPDSEQYRGLIHLFPEMKSIYMIRNGVSVVASRTQHPSFRHREFAEHCRKWVHYAGRYRYLSSTESSIEVRQEQLAADPSSLFERIFGFVGLKSDGKPAEYAKRSLIGSMDDSTRVGVDVREILKARDRAYERWSKEDRQTFKQICGPTMEELGYRIEF